ncbi:glutamate decarboxylase [Colwelliaceae bacterium MEBiC 14330]
MGLHKSNKAKDTYNDNDDEIYTDNITRKPLPKHALPSQASHPESVYNLIKDELLLDGNSRQNLATFCTTWTESEVQNLMIDSFDKNMIDKDEYPQTAEIESRCVNMLANLWNANDANDVIGCSTTGSSEAAMLGGLALKWQWRKKRQAQNKDSAKPNIVVGPVQICWKKFARYFDVELREVPINADTYSMRGCDIEHYVDENTIAVVPTLGVTFTGMYEPVEEISKALDDIQAKTGLDIPIHIDAASGGFIAPFLSPELKWDFRLPRVKSINASGHKYGLCPLGVGWVVWANSADLPEELIFNVDYLGGHMPTFALNFSRPGGQIIAQYYNFVRYGFEGFKHIQQQCCDTATWLAEKLAALPEFELIYDGQGGLPCVSYKLADNVNDFNLYDLSDRVRMRGWQIASYPLPKHLDDTVIQRILFRHGVSIDMASILLDDIKAAIAYFKKHPTSGKQVSPSYHH